MDAIDFNGLVAILALLVTVLGMLGTLIALVVRLLFYTQKLGNNVQVIQDDVTTHGRVLFGNGKAGIVETLTRMEQHCEDTHKLTQQAEG